MILSTQNIYVDNLACLRKLYPLKFSKFSPWSFQKGLILQKFVAILTDGVILQEVGAFLNEGNFVKVGRIWWWRFYRVCVGGFDLNSFRHSKPCLFSSYHEWLMKF